MTSHHLKCLVLDLQIFVYALFPTPVSHGCSFLSYLKTSLRLASLTSFKMHEVYDPEVKRPNCAVNIGVLVENATPTRKFNVGFVFRVNGAWP